ncbi:conserved hypothetical protein [Trichinella spiralis]|uniref:hypothetical protein n=1 Tax=Trichinella spiralis TaxID=6334 RepID=UPI0001EFCB5A|nr:conserved hypothetical protein [Trichinella spiralis]
MVSLDSSENCKLFGISKFIFDPGVHPPPHRIRPYTFIDLLDIPIDPIGSISTTLATPGLVDVVILVLLNFQYDFLANKAVAQEEKKQESRCITCCQGFAVEL